MDANFEYFEKFIVKQIVNTVDYRPETDEYEINRIHISDDIINNIENEGIRYGLKKDQIGQIISQVAKNIRTKPAIKLRYDSIDVAEFKIGQHIKINILHPKKGPHYIELLVTNKYHFYVLASDIAGIRYGDEIHALDCTWNIGYHADFTVTFGNNRHLSEELILRLGKLQCVEMFSPSVVHEILDSESTFSYDSLNAIQGEKIVDKSKDIKYYFWIPDRCQPVTFRWREGDAQDKTRPFIIIDNEDAPEAKITINKAFRLLPTEGNNPDSSIEIIFDCCKWRNDFNGIDNLKYIKPVKPGVVKRVVSDLGYKEWVLISQPQIKFIYE